jgi:AICAR transformylase/IMP cyclohydrolase PurH
VSGPGVEHLDPGAIGIAARSQTYAKAVACDLASAFGEEKIVSFSSI